MASFFDPPSLTQAEEKAIPSLKKRSASPGSARTRQMAPLARIFFGQPSTHRQEVSMRGSIRCGSKVNTFVRAALAVLLLFFLAAGQASAERNTEDSGSKQKLQEAKQQAEKYAQKLRDIQKKVMEKNPELEKRRNELQQMHKEKMNELVSENATRKERIQAIMRLRQDQELMEKRKSVQKDFLKAMQKEDSKTKEYLDKLGEARKTMRRINQNRSGQGQMGQ
jgi:hypothetical protein